MTSSQAKELEQFYFGDLPRVLFIVGLIIVAFNLLMLALTFGLTGSIRATDLLPPQSGLMTGVIALALSSAIKSSGTLSLLLSLTGPLLVLFFYAQMKRGIEGISPQIFLQMGILAIGTILFFLSLFFIHLTFKFKRENKFPA